MSTRLILTASMFAVLGVGAFGWLSSAASPAPTSATLVQGGSGDHYDLNSLHGAHGFSYSGTRVGVGPVASSGRIEFDGSGGLFASFTTSVNGHVFTGTFTGTYLVRADGTGSVLIQLPWLGAQARGTFVIQDHGAGTYFTSTDAGYSVTGTTRRM
mgnify:CR=1 FL=1